MLHYGAKLALVAGRGVDYLHIEEIQTLGPELNLSQPEHVSLSVVATVNQQ